MRGRQEWQREEMMEAEISRGATSQRMLAASRSWKRQATNDLLDLSEGTSPANTWILAPGDSSQTYDPPEL